MACQHDTMLLTEPDAPTPTLKEYADSEPSCLAYGLHDLELSAAVCLTIASSDNPGGGVVVAVVVACTTRECDNVPDPVLVILRAAGQQHVCRLTTAAASGVSFARHCCEALPSQCSYSRALASHCGNRHRRTPAPLQRI